jgi:FixJ family two-component response regulator
MERVCIIDGDRSTYDAVAGCFASVQWLRDAATFLDQVDDPAGRLVIVANTDLPGIGGIELIGRLRSLGRMAPVILVCRGADVATAVRAMRQGAADFMEKPVNGSLLVGAIRELLRPRGAARSTRDT